MASWCARAPRPPELIVQVGLYIGLLCFHGLINCLATKYLARLTASFVVINMCAALAIWIALGVTVDNKNSANYIFTTVVNTTGYSSDGFAFLFGLLSVQWCVREPKGSTSLTRRRTMTDCACGRRLGGLC